ncbi:MAG: hypothetical protein AAB011_10375 [Candidatus Eisenbacteria bacterium]
MTSAGRRLAIAMLLGFAFATTLAIAPRAPAQSLWLPRDSKHTVMLEMLRPNVERINGDVFSAAYFLGGRSCLGDRVAITWEIPFVHYDGAYSNDYYYSYYPYGQLAGVPQSAAGNPYVGIETRSGTKPFFMEFGFRLPLATEEEWRALGHGKNTDRLRSNAFATNVTSIEAAFNVREITTHRMVYRLRLSPILTLPSSTGDPELYGNYSFEIGYQGRWARVGAGMSGSSLLTASYGNLGIWTQSQFDLHGDFLAGAIRPGIALRMPTGSAAASVPLVLGVTLAWVR